MYRGELARCADLLAFQLGKAQAEVKGEIYVYIYTYIYIDIHIYTDIYIYTVYIHMFRGRPWEAAPSTPPSPRQGGISGGFG